MVQGSSAMGKCVSRLNLFHQSSIYFSCFKNKSFCILLPLFSSPPELHHWEEGVIPGLQVVLGGII